MTVGLLSTLFMIVIGVLFFVTMLVGTVQEMRRLFRRRLSAPDPLSKESRALVADNIAQSAKMAEIVTKALPPHALRVRELEKENAWLREENQRLHNEKGYR